MATDALGISFLCNLIDAVKSNEYPESLARAFLRDCAVEYEKIGGDGTFEKVPFALRAVAFHSREITKPHYRLASLTRVADFSYLYSVKRVVDAAKLTKRKSSYDKLFRSLPPGRKPSSRFLERARKFAGELILHHGFELGSYGIFWASRLDDPFSTPVTNNVDACNDRVTEIRSTLGLAHLEKGDLAVEFWIGPSVDELRRAGIKVARPVAIDAVEMRAYRHRAQGDVCPYPDGWGRAIYLTRFCESSGGSTGSPEIVLGPVRSRGTMSVGCVGQIKTSPFEPINQAEFLCLLAGDLSAGRMPLEIAKEASYLGR